MVYCDLKISEGNLVILLMESLNHLSDSVILILMSPFIITIQIISDEIL
jgi:hypothetical protein